MPVVGSDTEAGGRALGLLSVAAPVYNAASARNFAGTVQTGQTASAVHASAMPAKKGNKVAVMVDLDDRHTVAEFRGAIG